ncbi:MAG: hypothetical protein Q4G48_03870 [Bacteroidia bacterium]|nr:hypothetical protein [Bacteroidia bacterium]
MKKIIFITIIGLLIGVSGANAQSFLDKLDKAVNQIDRASKSADKASKTGNKVLSLLGGKDKSADNQTVLQISGIDLAALKNLNGIVESVKGVSATKMKFNAAKSVITVQHSGATEDLLANIQQASKDIFGDEHVTALEEGLIEIQLK